MKDITHQNIVKAESVYEANYHDRTAEEEWGTGMSYAIKGNMTFVFPNGAAITCPDFRLGVGFEIDELYKIRSPWWLGSSGCIRVQTNDNY